MNQLRIKMNTNMTKTYLLKIF